jgi:hypothetical protein
MFDVLMELRALRQTGLSPKELWVLFVIVVVLVDRYIKTQADIEWVNRKLVEMEANNPRISQKPIPQNGPQHQTLPSSEPVL